MTRITLLILTLTATMYGCDLRSSVPPECNAALCGHLACIYDPENNASIICGEFVCL